MADTSVDQSKGSAPAQSDADGRRFSLASVFIATAAICIWLALFVNRSGGILVYIAPYFFLLYLGYRFIWRAASLAIVYFLIHAVACGITLYCMSQSNDGTERWMVSLPLVILDLPVTLLVVFWEPPGILFPMYVFFTGGLFWAVIGWCIAQAPYRSAERGP